MITEIKKGDRFRCKRTFTEDNRILHIEGKEYISEEDGCITDEAGEKYDEWYEYTAEHYFTRIEPDSDVTQDLEREKIVQDELEKRTTAQINWNKEEQIQKLEEEGFDTTMLTSISQAPEADKARQFDTGSKRDNDDNKPLPMEMNPYMLMRYGYHMKYGQVRYGDGNWELQQPDIEIWRSMSRHFMQAYMNFKFPEQAKATDDGTDHLSALLFGINMLMHNECSKGVEADMYFKRRDK